MLFRSSETGFRVRSDAINAVGGVDDWRDGVKRWKCFGGILHLQCFGLGARPGSIRDSAVSQVNNLSGVSYMNVDVQLRITNESKELFSVIAH